MDTYIHHRFMEEMIVPLSALDPNYGIYLGENIERVKTSDGHISRCVYREWVDILSPTIEDDLKRLYGLSTIEYLRSWKKRRDYGSLYFLRIKLVLDD